jgi:hypothetical protein
MINLQLIINIILFSIFFKLVIELKSTLKNINSRQQQYYTNSLNFTVVESIFFFSPNLWYFSDDESDSSTDSYLKQPKKNSSKIVSEEDLDLLHKKIQEDNQLHHPNTYKISKKNYKRSRSLIELEEKQSQTEAAENNILKGWGLDRKSAGFDRIPDPKTRDKLLTWNADRLYINNAVDEEDEVSQEKQDEEDGCED